MRYSWPGKEGTGIPVLVMAQKGRARLKSFTLKSVFVYTEMQLLNFLLSQRGSTCFVSQGCISLDFAFTSSLCYVIH